MQNIIQQFGEKNGLPGARRAPEDGRAIGAAAGVRKEKSADQNK